ncbi:MAG: thiol protease/hemagglutinin PrtT, partial [Clostridium sp.]|nr:thiol protease/hemagglutinin PrtT [Clostridium sp.]
ALGRCAGGPSRVAARVAAAPVLPDTTYSDPSGLNTLYIFSSESGGYAVVSADDVALPLLGYSDTGRFDSRTIPPAMRGWLAARSAEIGAAAAAGVPSATETAAVSLSDYDLSHSGEILVESQWNQDDPYNSLCPVYYGSERCVTGCTATAVAQIMRYHRWPERGTGSNTYVDEIMGRDVVLSANFGETTYDWDNMPFHTYEYETAAQRNAVGTLMSHIGIAAGMDYAMDGNESGVSVLSAQVAMTGNFGYTVATEYLNASWFTADEWHRILLGELNAGRPVLYTGYSPGGGHAFVCDGYQPQGDNIYYHYNWGWGGVADGWFRYTALEPGTTIGIGGGSYVFNDGQEAVVGIRPAAKGDKQTASMVAYGSLSPATVYPSFGETIGLDCVDGDYNAFYNYSPVKGEQIYNTGLEMTSLEDGSVTYLKGPKYYGLDRTYGIWQAHAVIPQGVLPEGRYTARPVVAICNQYGNPTTAWNRFRFPKVYCDSVNVVIGKHHIEFYNAKSQTAHLLVDVEELPEETYDGETFNCTLSIGTEYSNYSGHFSLKIKHNGIETELGRTSRLSLAAGAAPKQVTIECNPLDWTFHDGGDLYLTDGNNRIVGELGEFRTVPEPASIGITDHDTTDGGFRAGDTVEILSASGQLLRRVGIEADGTEPSMTDLPAGVYLLRSGSRVVKKIIR